MHRGYEDKIQDKAHNGTLLGENDELLCQKKDRKSHKGLIISHVAAERLQIVNNIKCNWDLLRVMMH